MHHGKQLTSLLVCCVYRLVPVMFSKAVGHFGTDDATGRISWPSKPRMCLSTNAKQKMNWTCTSGALCS